MKKLSQALLRYYAALQISAGIMSVVLPDAPRREKPPVVQVAEMEAPGGFDRREMVYVGARPHVVTTSPIPDSHGRDGWASLN